MNKLERFYQSLWQKYLILCPQARSIHHLFQNEGEVLVNDHVAFRTIANSPICIDQLEPRIISLGYEYLESYHFEAKKLNARCYIHPLSPTKIFISELLHTELTIDTQNIIRQFIEQIDTTTEPDLNAGRMWQLPTFEQYQSLIQQSEYAAWVSIWGLCANHFTVYVNHLQHFDNLEQVVSRLSNQGYQLNPIGGFIKGKKSDLLIQSSTLACLIPVLFSDAGEQEVAGCYYEFAQRFSDSNGELFQGFIPSSADKIFESTNRGHAHD